MYTITWTGQSMWNAGLLYESYADLANVHRPGGAYAGCVLRLTNGKFKASTFTQVCVGRDFATAREAFVALIKYDDPSYEFLD